MFILEQELSLYMVFYDFAVERAGEVFNQTLPSQATYARDKIPLQSKKYIRIPELKISKTQPTSVHTPIFNLCTPAHHPRDPLFSARPPSTYPLRISQGKPIASPPLLSFVFCSLTFC